MVSARWPDHGQAETEAMLYLSRALLAAPADGDSSAGVPEAGMPEGASGADAEGVAGEERLRSGRVGLLRSFTISLFADPKPFLSRLSFIKRDYYKLSMIDSPLPLSSGASSFQGYAHSDI